MKKKYLIVGMAAILGASLSFFGCESATDGAAGAAGTPGEPGIISISGSQNLEGLQGLVDAAVTSGAALYFNNVELTGGGSLDLKTVKVIIAGNLETDATGGSILNLARATVSFVDTTGGIALGAATDVAVGTAEQLGKKGSTGIYAVPAEGGVLPDVGGVTAIENYTLTATANDVISGLTVYVYGTLTVDADSVAPTGTVKAIGTVEVSATNAAALAGTTVDITAATLTNTAAATVTLPAGTATIKAIKAGDAALTLAGATGLALGSLTGSVTLPAGITAVTIDGGAGSVTITPTAALTLGTASFGNTGTTTFGGAQTVTITPAATFGGDAVFNGDVTFTAGATFGGNAVFKGDVTLTDGDAVFEKDAFFADGKAITLTAATSIITLKPGAELAHGAPATGVPTVYSAIIANFDESTDVTLTPAENTKLTFGATGTKSITQDSSTGSAAHGITIGGAASLVPSATYTVASADTKVGTLTVDTGATLFVGKGILEPAPEGFGPNADNDDATSSKLVLTGAASTAGAKLDGEGSVVAGGTTITGGDSSGAWQAVGTGTVTIEADAITGAGGEIALTGTTDDGAVIAVAAAENAAATLTVTTASIDIATKGTVTLTGHATGSVTATLKLKGAAENAAALVISSESTPVTTVDTGDLVIGGTDGSTNPAEIKVNGASITTSAGNVDDVVVKAASDDATTATAVGTLGGGDATDSTEDLEIVSSANPSTKTTIKTGDTIKANASS